jgi:mono/diheme cytochrome c family protein
VVSLRSLLRPLAVVLSLLLVPLALRAHEVPAQVGVRAYVVPTASRVRLAVQIPMDAVRDIDWPRRGNGMLDVPRSQPYLEDAARLWIADALRLRDGARVLPPAQLLAVRAALPSDGAFARFATAEAAVAGQPLDPAVMIDPLQLRLEALLEVPADGLAGDLVLEAQWAHLGRRTTTVLQLVQPDGTERVFTWEGDPGPVRLDPRWWQAAGRFVREGVHHLLGGVDHLLFLFLLVLPLRALRPLVGVVTAFTAAHSLTLMAAALGYAPSALWFAPLVEVLIAASIVYTAAENLLGVGTAHRWRLAFGFGLIHGFGFSAALGNTLQFAGRHLVPSLLAFNVGLELAQVAVVALTVPFLAWLIARGLPERGGIMLASALVAHEAWHWMTARWATFQAYPIGWPTFDTLLLMDLVRMLLLLAVALGMMWGLSALFARYLKPAGGAASIVLGLLAGTALLLRPSTLPAQGAPPATTMAGIFTVAQATKGKNVFFSNCLGCHTVASHTGQAFQLKWFGRPLHDLYDYLSSAMPKTSPGSLSEDEYVWVTAYILRLNGMPPGRTELSPEPSWLKAVRVDSSTRGPSRPTTHPSP